MPGTPEAQARQEIDRLLEAAGWHVCDAKAVNLHAARGVADRAAEEADRFTYNLWRPEQEDVDAHLVGLSAAPNTLTFGHNPLKEYGHPQPVADGVNYDVYRIKTEVTDAGSKVEAGYGLQVLAKPTRARRDWQRHDDVVYAPEELDRSVQTPGQIPTIVRTLRDIWQSDLISQRQKRPTTLVPARDDDYAECIVEILRQEFGQGNEFAQKMNIRMVDHEGTLA